MSAKNDTLNVKLLNDAIRYFGPDDVLSMVIDELPIDQANRILEIIDEARMEHMAEAEDDNSDAQYEAWKDNQ